MIIGFAGRARHGKDFCAGHAQSLLRGDAMTRGFAQSLKNRVYRALDGVPNLAEAIQEKPPWMRSILQAVGENVRQASPNFWVDDLFKWWEKQHHTPTWPCAANDARHLLVPDVRYPNEVEAIKKRGGKAIKVVRLTDGVEWQGDPDLAGKGWVPCKIPYRAPGTDPNHPSEAMIDTIPDTEFDRIFTAEDGMLDYLKAMTEQALRDWNLYA